MSGPPSNVLQFEDRRMTPEDHRKVRAYYFGSCGPEQGFWPKRHSWGPWTEHTIQSTGTRFKERICGVCSLVSDPIYLKQARP